jgi:hypothetical protein
MKPRKKVPGTQVKTNFKVGTLSNKTISVQTRNPKAATFLSCILSRIRIRVIIKVPYVRLIDKLNCLKT